MNVMVDFIMCFLAATAVFLAVGRNTIMTAARLGALVLAVALSIPAVHYGTPYLAEKIENPLANMAVEDLAELDDIDTEGQLPSSYISLIDYDALKQTPGMEKLLAAYGVDAAGTDRAAENGVRAAAAYMTMPLWQAIVATMIRLVVVLVMYSIVLAVLRAVLYRKFAKVKRKNLAPMTVLCALLSMVVMMAYVVVPVSEAFRPFTMGALQVVQWDRACAESVVYPLFEMMYLL